MAVAAPVLGVVAGPSLDGLGLIEGDRRLVVGVSTDRGVPNPGQGRGHRPGILPGGGDIEKAAEEVASNEYGGNDCEQANERKKRSWGRDKVVGAGEGSA